MNLDATLQRAAALMRAGRLADGAALCRQLLGKSPQQPDALHLLAIAARDGGNLAEAETLFRRALAVAAQRAPLLVDFGTFLRAQGRMAEAEVPLRTAARLAPDFAPAWRALAALLRASSQLDEAAGCARQFVELAPSQPAGWELLAAIEQQSGNLDVAIAACEAGLRHSPGAARLHYSLGQLLREDCQFDASVRAYDAARRHGFEAPELYQNLGESHAEAGAIDQALATFTTGVARFPDHPSLQRLRARFHWESGTAGDPVAALWQQARSRPANPALWQTLADLLSRLDRKEECRQALEESQRLGCEQSVELQLLGAINAGQIGDRAGAMQRFDGLVAAHPQHPGIQLAFAEHLLAAGDPARTEALCASILEDSPYGQPAWALRGTAWQLLGDPRATWLLDYQRMIMPVQVLPPEGTDSASFFGEVEAALLTCHRMQAHPIDQTLRGGTQTNGYLFRLKHDALRALEMQIRIAVRTALARHPVDPKHPFWGRRGNAPRGDGFRFAGAWSVRLANLGYHTHHIHPQGWISSALYVALPAEVRDGHDDAGCVQFGVPPAEMGLTIAPGRTVKPKVGELLLFPSYMWHGTVPFTSAQARITVAFDLLPQ